MPDRPDQDFGSIVGVRERIRHCVILDQLRVAHHLYLGRDAGASLMGMNNSRCGARSQYMRDSVR